MPHVTLTMELPNRLIASLRTQIDKTDKARSLREVMNVANGLLSGSSLGKGYARVCIASACATATIGCDQSDAVDATDEVAIGGTTLAVEAAPANESEFLKGDDDIEFAANLAAAINAHSVISKLVRATSDGIDTVTVTSLYPGPIGNLITLTEAGNGFTISGAVLADGASDEVDGYQFGYVPAV